MAVTYTDRGSWDKMTRGSGWIFDNFEICGGVSTNCDSGDAYVDIVGIDNYDHGPTPRP